MQASHETGARRTPRLAVREAVGLTVLLACGCGGAEPSQPRPESRASAGAERPAPSRRGRDGMEVTGLLGTLPAERIDSALKARLPAFQRCFFDGMDRVEFLGGGIEFQFAVDADGRVVWVHPARATIGHRMTERCLLERAAETRFPRPRGGDGAEFVWGFELDPPGGVRPPVAWDADEVEPARQALAAAAADCGAGVLQVTAYVVPGGQVLAAGAASEQRVSPEALDCVVAGVEAQTLPDPGSYAAKVTFQLR